MKQVTWIGRWNDSRRITIAVGAVLVLLAAIGVTRALAVNIGGYNIDGTVPDAGAVAFPDTFGSSDELGAVNSNATKLLGIHTAAKPMLAATNPNAQVDLRNVWLDTNVDGANQVWLYFAWERDSSNGSGVIMYEFQQEAAPASCDYSLTQAQLIASCNPWENRRPGDFIIVWDQAGKKINIIKRTFTSNDTNPANGQWDGPVAEPLLLDADVTLSATISDAAVSADE